MAKFNPYALKKPCANCPFLKNRENAIPLQEGRVEGIIESLLNGEATSFACHKTTHQGHWEEDDEGEGVYVSSGKEQQCAGSLAVLEKLNRPTILMKVMQAYQAYNPENLAPIHDQIIDVEVDRTDRRNERVIIK